MIAQHINRQGREVVIMGRHRGPACNTGHVTSLSACVTGGGA